MKGKSGIGFDGFVYQFELRDQAGNLVDAWSEHNLVPQAGLNFLIQAPFGDVAPISAFYAGLYRGNYIPSSATTSADIPGAMNEFVNYSETSRPVWSRTYDGAGTVDNSADRAIFTFTSDATIYGSFLVSSSVKGGNTGLLVSVVRFASPRVIPAGLTLNLTSGITYVPTNVV